MRPTKKEEQLLLDILRAVYFEIGVSFDEIDKTKKDWFLNYYLPQSRQDVIIDSMLNTIKTTKLKKQMLKNALYLGVLPKS